MNEQSKLKIETKNPEFIKTTKIMENQPTINIGTIGHVAHGKSTLVKGITGTKTVRFKSEMVRNITMKLGYANARIFQCEKCPRPDCYQTFSNSELEDADISENSFSSESEENFKKTESPRFKNLFCKNKILKGGKDSETTTCNGHVRLVKHVSFIDCPGHDVLMATMLSGASIMDGAVLLIASNESCPQSQTKEHLFAVEIMHLGDKNSARKKIIVVQNKIDLITREQALEQHDQIKKFLRSSSAEVSPVIPVAAERGINLNAVMDFIVNQIEEPKRDEGPGRMVIIRSFDVNKPGTLYTPHKNEKDEFVNEFSFENLSGGVVGGTIVEGSFKKGETVEIRPGILENHGKPGKLGRKIYGPCKESETDFCAVCRDRDVFVSKPFVTQITSLKAEDTELETAVSGGLLGVGTTLDPFFVKSDKLVGQMIGGSDTLPDVFGKIAIKSTLFGNITGNEIKPLGFGELLLLNIGSTSTPGVLTKLCNCVSLINRLSAKEPEKTTESNENIVAFDLLKPACCDIGDKIAISRKIDKNWRLIGYGTILSGAKIQIKYQ